VRQKRSHRAVSQASDLHHAREHGHRAPKNHGAFGIERDSHDGPALDVDEVSGREVSRRDALDYGPSLTRIERLHVDLSAG